MFRQTEAANIEAQRLKQCHNSAQVTFQLEAIDSLAHRPHLAKCEDALELGLEPKLLHSDGHLSQLARDASEQLRRSEKSKAQQAEEEGDRKNNSELFGCVQADVVAVLAAGRERLIVAGRIGTPFAERPLVAVGTVSIARAVPFATKARGEVSHSVTVIDGGCAICVTPLGQA